MSVNRAHSAATSFFIESTLEWRKNENKKQNRVVLHKPPFEILFVRFVAGLRRVGSLDVFRICVEAINEKLILGERLKISLKTGSLVIYFIKHLIQGRIVWEPLNGTSNRLQIIILHFDKSSSYFGLKTAFPTVFHYTKNILRTAAPIWKQIVVIERK